MRQQWVDENGQYDGNQHYLTPLQVVPGLYGWENWEQERNQSNSEDGWQTTAEIPVPGMSSIEASDFVNDVDLEEFPRGENQWAIEVRVQGSQSSTNWQSNKEITLQEQLNERILWLFDVIEADGNPGDGSRWSNVRQQGNDPQEPSIFMSSSPWEVTQSNGGQHSFQGVDQSSAARIEPEPGSRNYEKSPFRFVCPNVKSVVTISAQQSHEQPRNNRQKTGTVQVKQGQHFINAGNQSWIEITANSFWPFPCQVSISETKYKQSSDFWISIIFEIPIEEFWKMVSSEGGICMADVTLLRDTRWWRVLFLKKKYLDEFRSPAEIFKLKSTFSHLMTFGRSLNF